MRITGIKNFLSGLWNSQTGNYKPLHGRYETRGEGLIEGIGEVGWWILRYIVIPIIIPIAAIVVIAIAIKVITSIFTIATIKTIGAVLGILLALWFIGTMILETHNL